ncbi:MAG: tetratricopeptide repeat protein [Methylococcales bacterium]
MLIFRLILVLALILLNSCADFSEKLSDSEVTAAPVRELEVKEKVKQKEQKSSIDPEILFTLLTAELAGQRGQYDIALDGYIEVAKRTQDAKFSERAVMIAMYVKNSNKTKEALGLWLRQDPKNLSARKIAALLALRSGNKSEATEHLNAMLIYDATGFESALLELAGVIQKEGRVDIIYDVLDELSKQHKDNAEIYFIQSLMALQKKDKNLAETKIQQTLRLKPDWEKAVILQAQIAVFGGDFNKAKLLLSDASDKYPNNSKINRMLAQILIKTGGYKEAIELYKKIILADPKDFESQFAEGLVHLQLDQDQQAEDVFKKMLEQPDWRYQACFYLGKLEEKQGNEKKALSWFDQVTEGPFAFDASVSAISLLQKEKHLEEAGSRLSLLQMKFPRQKLQLVLVQAELYNQQKKYDEAISTLSNALTDFPNQKELLYTRALILERINKLDLAEIDLKKILAIDPNNFEALNALGYTLLNNSGRYVEAEKLLQKALDLDPNEAVIIDSFGWLQFKLGHLDQALKYLQQAYERQPENEIAAHLAEVLWVLGRKDEARTVFERAIKGSPDDEYLQDFKKRILRGE